MLRRSSLSLISLLFLATACSTLKQPSGTQEPSSGVETGAQPTPPSSATGGRYSGRLSSKVDPRKVAEQLSGRPVNVSTRCSFKNETGYAGQAMVDVTNGEAKQVHVIVNVPAKGGGCLFDMSGFKQTQRGAMVEIRHPKDGCTARIWEQGAQTTVSFSNCAARCTPNETFKYVWPVLIDRPSGQCD